MQTISKGFYLMKVLMINAVCGIGSTGRICTDLADEYEKQGFCVKIAYGRGSVPKQYERIAVKIGNDFNVKRDSPSCPLCRYC